MRKNMKVCDLGKAAAALRAKEGGEKTGNTVHLVGVGTTVITLVMELWQSLHFCPSLRALD